MTPKPFILRVSPQVANNVAEVEASQATTNNTLINPRKMWSVIIVIRKDTCKSIITRSKGKKEQFECYYCHKFDHVQANFYKKEREEGHASFVEEKDDHSQLFMAKIVEKNGCEPNR
jgi:hypothetical protein